MDTALLIEKAEFLKDKLVATSIDEERLRSSIREAQQFDLRPVLGDAMYYDLIKNYDVNESPINKYNKLVEGEEYTNSESHTIIFSGLRMALKYWAYARFIAKQQVNATASSVVVKTNPWSVPVAPEVIEAETASARSGAISYWEEAKKYLDEKFTDFPLWVGQRSVPRSGVRITAVGGGQRRVYDKATKRFI
jgi:hypothetical protein